MVAVTVKTDILSAKKLTVKKSEFTFGPPSGKVVNWLLEVLDESGKTVKQYSGEGQLPASLTWNGKDEDGWLVQRGASGAYRLTLKYADGKQEQAGGKLSTEAGG